MKYLKLILLINLAFITGCTSQRLYEGQALPPNQIVTIKGMNGIDPLNGGISVLVCEIDNKEIEGCASSVEFLPGKHKLTLEARNLGLAQGGDRIEKEFKAGEVYLLGIEYRRVGRGSFMYPVLIKQKSSN